MMGAPKSRIEPIRQSNAKLMQAIVKGVVRLIIKGTSKSMTVCATNSVPLTATPLAKPVACELNQPRGKEISCSPRRRCITTMIRIDSLKPRITTQAWSAPLTSAPINRLRELINSMWLLAVKRA